MDDVINVIAHLLGVEPAVLIGLLPLIVLVANLIGRSIPDDRNGFLGFIRKVAKVIGLYMSNRVSAGVSVNKVTRAVIEGDVQARSPETGRFDAVANIVKNEQGLVRLNYVLMSVFVALAALLLAGCVTATRAVEFTCTNKEKVKQAAEAVIKAVDKACPLEALNEAVAESTPDSEDQ